MIKYTVMSYNVYYTAIEYARLQDADARIQDCATRYSTRLRYAILIIHYTILYYTILYYTILYYTIIYYNIL